MTRAIVGYTGFIGKYLCQQITFDSYYNTQNITNITGQTYDAVYCAAPSGNRIRATDFPEQDRDNVIKLIDTLDSVKTPRLVLIGTLDSLANCTSPYGKHRAQLEMFVRQRFSNYHIVRLGSLVDPAIEKNIIYDLKHQMWLESINLAAANQWTPLQDLVPAIEQAVRNNIPEINLVSEPVLNRDIVNRFASNLASKITQKNTAMHYNIKPYRYTQEEIMQHIQRYLQ